MQYLKTSLLDFVKSTKNTKVLYSTYDLNNQNKKMFIFNWKICDAGSFNMQVNFKNEIKANKIFNDSVFTIKEVTDTIFLKQL